MAGSKRLEAQTRGGTGALGRPPSTLDTRGLPQAPALEGLTVCTSTSPAQARRTTRRRSPEQVSGGSGRQAPGVGAGRGLRGSQLQQLQREAGDHREAGAKPPKGLPS